jgi:hypothetical protein
MNGRLRQRAPGATVSRLALLLIGPLLLGPLSGGAAGLGLPAAPVRAACAPAGGEAGAWPGRPAQDVGTPYLAVESPTTGTTVDRPAIDVRGRTTPGRTVEVLDEDGGMTVAAVDESGAFCATVELEPGPNYLLVISAVAGDLQAPILHVDLTVHFVPAP